jgi:preprotein translocase subunit SecE
MNTIEKNIIEITNKHIEEIEEEEVLELHVFTRVSAKKLTFRSVVFNYSTFQHCYFRRCKFDSCKFIGCKFISTNFEGSEFIGCTFDYSTFRFTNLDENILDNNCPSYENVRQKFARSLRTNFLSMGNSEGVNKAITVELEATKEYLYKSWRSKESHYRKKYKGRYKFLKFLEWVKFKIEEIIWGNGESLWKLARAVFIVLLFITVNETIVKGDVSSLPSYWSSLKKSPQLFFSIDKPEYYTKFFLSIIFFFRLIFFGLFMAIIIKRFSKR